jgi:hypothetical protein
MTCPSMDPLRGLINAAARCPDCNHVAAVHGRDDLECDICALLCSVHRPARERRP